MQRRLLLLIPLALLALGGAPSPAAATAPEAPVPAGHCNGARTESVLDDSEPGHCNGARVENVLDDAPGHCNGASGAETLRQNI